MKSKLISDLPGEYVNAKKCCRCHVVSTTRLFCNNCEDEIFQEWMEENQ